MKRILALTLAISFIISLCGCGGDIPTDVSSATKSEGTAEVESKNTQSELSESNSDSEIIETNSSDVQSTAEQVVNSSEDVSSYVSNNESTVSKSAKKKKKTKKQKGDVPISDVYNPTGISSVGRKNNSGKDWMLTLVNPWNTLDLDYSVGLSNIDSRFADGDKLFDSRAVKYLNQMCEAAANDGVQLWIISAYRTYDYQSMLFNNEVSEYYSYHPNASRDEAEKGAATEVARPGTSEHNLGLAIDFNSVEQSFENTEQYAWLSKHCTEYGFIMRYAADKQSATGVIYEPWHYRYVGKKNAQKIAASGLCLEEWIKKNK